MATTVAEIRDTYRGGYRDRPWIPRFWHGITFPAWIRLLGRHRFRLSVLRLATVLAITLFSVMNYLLWAVQVLVFGRRIARTKIDQDPIFIIGHWRSGTTLLHELLVLDGRHTYPSTYACFAPNHYLVTRRVFPRILSMLMPDRRPMDNMPAGWDRPQEDEFALCAMGVPSPYNVMAFPNEPQQEAAYLNLQGLSPRALARWKRAFVWFLKCLTLVDPRRIVLKSPPHTGRVRVLLDLFPRARFIHIVRDPRVVFPSTLNLWKRLYTDQGLQTPNFEGLEERVFATFDRMYAAFERDRALIPPSQISEVRYEDLVRSPTAEMRRIYDDLGLDGFDDVLPALEEYLASQSGYQKNRYSISPETRLAIGRRWGEYIAKYGYSDTAEQDAA